MAAILQLRRGTTPSTTIAEPYFNTSLGTLQIGDGSTSITLVKIGSNTGNVAFSGTLGVTGISTLGVITGSNLYITENVTIDGNIHIGGNITLGSGSDGDIVNVNAPLSGSLIPDTTEVYDLGASDKKYRNIFAVSASFDSILLPGSGILSSSTDNFTNFSQSVDSRLDTVEQSNSNSDDRLTSLESFTSSQETKNSTIETYTSSVDSDLTELFSSASDHESRIDVIEGTFSSSVDFRLNYLEEEFSTSVDDRLDLLEIHSASTDNRLDSLELTSASYGDRLDQLETETGSIELEQSIQDGRLDNLELTSESHDSRLDSLEGASGSYATTGSNSFVGDQQISGSVFISGSQFEAKVGWPSVGTQNHLFEPESFILNLSSGDRTYTYNALGMEHYEDEPGTYHNSFLFHLWDSTSYNYGSELNIGPINSFFRIFASGSDSIGNISVTDLQDGTTRANLYGNEVHLGAFLGDTILIGNTGSYINIKADNIIVESNISSSANIAAVKFYGDGENLTNITASYVDYSDIDNKPTLVSGSSQIDVNDTQNFQSFSSSVDGRLDTLEGSFSTSVDSRLDNVELYTSSLKQAIDVNGQDLTIYGNLVVQGETTTLNTTELVIEDKLLSVASGSTTSAQADGAGIHISGADASMLWDDANSNLVFNQKISSSVGFKGDGSELTNIQHENIDFGSSLIVSGSDQLSSSFDFRYLEINGDNVVSGSSQIVITDTTGFSTFSGSLKSTDDGQDSRLINLESFSSSQETKNSTLSTLTASYDGRLSNLESFTSSQETKNSTLATYTGSVNSHISNLELFTGSQEDKNITLQSYTESVDSQLTELYSTASNHEDRIDTLESFSSSIDDTVKIKLDVEGVVSSSLDTSTISLSIQDGVISGDVIGEVVSGSAQLTSSLDFRYLEIDGDNVVSGSDQVTGSLDSRYEEIASGTHTLVSGSDQLTSSLDLRYEESGSVAQLVGIYQVSGSLGSAAWYNVSASISDGNPQVLGNAGAVKTYIDEALVAVGAGDITKVTAGLGMSGSTDFGEAVVAIDTASAHFTNGVLGAIEPFSSSVDTRLNELSQSAGYISYITNSIENLTGIEVADFDSNVAVTFIDGTLKFIFGTPDVPTSVAASLSGFLNDRFNQVQDEYNINGNWNNGGYTLISASLFEDSTLLTKVGTGTSLSFTTTTSGSHTYQLQYTASSPLDGSIFTTSTTVSGTLSKTNPASPTLTPTATVQLGASGNQIEQGATGSISFTSSSADPSNGWNLVDVTTNVESPYLIEGPLTGSSNITISATANYESPIGDNNPDLTTTSTASRTYTKIRSLRYGASTATSFTEGDLANLALWDTTLGGDIGTIAKGTTNPSGQSVTITWSGDKFHYIVFDSSRSNLSNITTAGFGVFGSFTLSTVGQYKIYKINTLQAGGAGSTITYTLT